MSTKIKGYQFIKELGNGKFGKVYDAVQMSTGQHFAIKVIHKSHDQYSFESVIHELEIGKKIGQNPYLVGTVDYFQSEENFYMVFEYCDVGSLDKYIKAHPLTEKEAIQFLIDIYKGYSYLYANKIVHRDLKPANILLKTYQTGKGKIIRAKISDYGLSKNLEHCCEKLTECLMEDGAGSPIYQSPELINGCPSNYQSDIFAIGVLFYQLIYQVYPFPAKSVMVMSEMYKKGTFKIDTSKMKVQSAEFILGCLQYKMDKRYKEISLDLSPLFGVPYSVLTNFKVKGDRVFNIHKLYKANSTLDDLVEVVEEPPKSSGHQFKEAEIN